MNFIHRNEGALEPHECTFVINYFNQNTDEQVEGQLGFGANSRVDPEKKLCQEMYLKSERLVNEFIFTPVARVLKETCEQYIAQFPFIDELEKWSIAPTFKIQKYLPKQGYFKTHCENDGGMDGYAETRMIAWMIYLNDVADGGETEFPHQKEKFRPTRGTCLFWPAYWTHPHHGLTSPSQDKYILTGWYNFNQEWRTYLR